MSSNRIVVQALGAAVSVSTLTVLMTWTKFDGYESALFSIQNTGATNTAYLVLETSQDGVRADGIITDTPAAVPGGQASIEIGPKQMRRYYRLSAQTASPTYPATTVTYEAVAGQ